MEPYIKNNVSDITYPERSYSSKNNFGIPKRHKNILLHSGYVRTYPAPFIYSYFLVKNLNTKKVRG
jgi:hypothetical protein